MPTIYLYTAEEQVVQQIGSAGLPATLRLDVSPDTDIELYEVLGETPSTITVVHTLDIKLYPVVDDSSPIIPPVPTSTVIYMFAGEIPYLASTPLPIVSANLRLDVSPDADVEVYESVPSLVSGEQFLKAVDILVLPYDYFVSGGLVTLTVQETRHILSSDVITLVQQHTLAVQETIHVLSNDTIALVQQYTLVVQETVHTQITDEITLVQQSLLVVQETVHALTSDNIELGGVVTLIVAFAIHQFISDNVHLTSGLPITNLGGAVGDINIKGNVFTIR
jgi:hypothetical protein